MQTKECPNCGEAIDKRGYWNHKKHCDDELIEKIERLYHEEKMSVSEVADAVDYTTEALRRKMKSSGIERRTRGEGQRLKHQSSLTTYWGNNGRFYIRFSEYNDIYTFQLSRMSKLRDHSIEEMNGMVVHHKNGHPADDRLDNLELVSRSEHAKKHYEMGDIDPNQ